MKQINKEFTEFLLTKTEGKFIEQLTLREYSLGESLPVFSNISLVNLKYDEDCPNPRPGVSLMFVIFTIIMFQHSSLKLK